MKAIIKGTSLSGEISAIPSKSYAHRALIANFLSGNQGKISGLYPSVDISATKNCIDSLVKGSSNVLDCAESGSTLRFMLPVCSALGGEFKFIGRGKLMQRPISELADVLSLHGIEIQTRESIIIKGKLVAGEYRIRGDISSQYITGLLMALPLLKGDSKIILTTPLQSKPYVDITISVLNHYGIKIEEFEQGFIVKGNQEYLTKDYVVEGDWSNAGYMLVIGAINDRIKVKGLSLNSLQADKKILSVIENAGGFIQYEEDGILISKPNSLKAFTFSAKDCPDLVPAASALACYCKGETIINDIERLKIKESDRVKSIIEMLKSFNVSAIEKNGDLHIMGGNLKAGIIDSYNDHRIAMAGTVIACGINGKSTISGAEAINKSYPTFYQDIISLKGEVQLEL